MKFSIQREVILEPLNQVIGVVERRQTLPVLANFLLDVSDGRLICTGTDMEVELVARCEAGVEDPGQITVPARKLLDICRALPEKAKLKFSLNQDQMQIQAGRSRYTLSTLPATEFPATDDMESLSELNLPEKGFKKLLDRTAFAMAVQDVRYYLNGLLLELAGTRLRAVATDGHRLAASDITLGTAADEEGGRQIIVPRKGVLEMQRLLGGQGTVAFSIGKNHVRLRKDETQLTSKLIDGGFPDYQAVIPIPSEAPVEVDRAALVDALQRAAILSNEKYRGVRLEVEDQRIRIVAHNPQHEEAVEEVEATHGFSKLVIGFNVSYLLDALAALDSERVQMYVKDANSSCLVRDPEDEDTQQVVMPLKL